MAKKIDPFEKFKEVTLGSSPSLSSAINVKKDTVNLDEQSVVPEPVQQTVAAPVPEIPIIEKQGKNVTRELVSFHIPKDMKKKLGLLKYELDRPFGDLYCEAVDDLLRKYGK